MGTAEVLSEKETSECPQIVGQGETQRAQYVKLSLVGSPLQYHGIEVLLKSYDSIIRIPQMAVRVQLDDQTLNQSKSHPRLPKTSQYKVLLYLLPFGCNSDVK